MSQTGPTGRDGPHTFVDDLDLPVLAADDRHHLARVLRLRDGAPFTVSDARGGWRVCRFGPVVEPQGPVQRLPPPALSLTVAFALTKGDRPEWVVQKLTELGIDRLVPITAERSVVRWDAERAERQRVRWERIARAAAAQSRRVRLPVIMPVTPMSEVIGPPGVALAEPGGGALKSTLHTIVVGPEGGWSPHELVGVPTVALGPQILRAETAAVAAAAVLSALRAGLVSPPDC